MSNDAVAGHVISKVRVGFIQHHQHVVGHAVEKGICRVGVKHGAGGIVGIGQNDHACLVIDGRGNSFQVVSILPHGSLNEVSADGLRDQRVTDKRSLTAAAV